MNVIKKESCKQILGGDVTETIATLAISLAGNAIAPGFGSKLGAELGPKVAGRKEGPEDGLSF